MCKKNGIKKTKERMWMCGQSGFTASRFDLCIRLSAEANQVLRNHKFIF